MKGLDMGHRCNTSIVVLPAMTTFHSAGEFPFTSENGAEESCAKFPLGGAVPSLYLLHAIGRLSGWRVLLRRVSCFGTQEKIVIAEVTASACG